MESAICATTSPLVTRDRDSPAGASPLSAGMSDGRVACSAGARPKISVVTTEITMVNASTIGLRRNPALKSMSNGSVIWLARVMAHWATRSPTAADAAAKTRLSVSSCLMSALRRAPRLRRMAISRARSRARARKRFATFTQLTSSRIITTAMTTDDRPIWAARMVGWMPASDCRTTVMPLSL